MNKRTAIWIISSEVHILIDFFETWCVIRILTSILAVVQSIFYRGLIGHFAFLLLIILLIMYGFPLMSVSSLITCFHCPSSCLSPSDFSPFPPDS